MKYLTLSLFILIFACSESKNTEDSNIDENQHTEIVKVGLALGDRGIGDQSFNDMQYNGLIEASRQFPIDISYRIPLSYKYEDIHDVMEELIIADQVSLLITGNNFATDAIIDLASSYPDTHFVVLDFNEALGSNITSINFSQEEASFLAGYLAAQISRSDQIGFIGGVDILPVQLFEQGFEAGILHADNGKELVSVYLSQSPDLSGFNSRDKAFEIATELYSSGIEIIFSAAGGSGLGVINAVRTLEDKKMIGVDSDQDYLAKGQIITSVMKRLDAAIVQSVQAYLENSLQGNLVKDMNLHNGGVGLSAFNYTRELVETNLREQLDQLSEQIADRQLTVVTRN